MSVRRHCATASSRCEANCPGPGVRGVRFTGRRLIGPSRLRGDEPHEFLREVLDLRWGHGSRGQRCGEEAELKSPPAKHCPLLCENFFVCETHETGWKTDRNEQRKESTYLENMLFTNTSLLPKFVEKESSIEIVARCLDTMFTGVYLFGGLFLVFRRVAGIVTPDR